MPGVHPRPESWQVVRAGWLPAWPRLVMPQAHRAEPTAVGTRHTCVSLIWRGIAGLSVVMLAVTGCGATRAANPKRLAHALARSASNDRTIVIVPQYGETFTPVAVSAAPALTAGQAWARFARLNSWSRTGVPSGVHVQLGHFTLPVGPADAPGTSHLVKANGEAYTALNELAYGYSSPSGCVTMNPRLLPPPDARCLFWTFLNANTGKQIVSSYQMIGHWHWLINPNGP